MRRGGWTWAAAIVAAGVLGAWYFWRGGVSTLFLLLLTAFMMVQGAIVQWCGPKRITAVRSWHPDYPVAGEEIAVTLTVTCSGGLPPLWLQVEDELAALAGGPVANRLGDRGGRLFFSGFKSVYHGTYSLEALSRGVYKGPAVRLSYGDPFGWFRRSLRVGTEDTLVIHPLPLSFCPPEAEERGEREGGGAFQPQPVVSSPAPGRLRQYEPGDPLRRIHWKYSAKKGMLLTRLPEEQGNMPRYLLLSAQKADYAWGGGQSPVVKGMPGEAPAADAVAGFELAVSAAASWLRREAGEPGELLFSHEGMGRAFRVSGCEGLYDGLEQLAGLRLGAGLSAAALLRRDWSRLLSHGQGLTVITGALTPELTGRVLHLAESGAAAEIWCACGLAGPDQPELLAARLRERGVAVVDLSSYPIADADLRKEGTGHASA